MKHLFLVITLSIFLNPNLLLAQVNMKNASYSIAFSDHREIKRTYSSRSVHHGVFGFGWCASFEVSLKLLSTDALLVKHCDKETRFELKYENSKERKRIYNTPSSRDVVEFRSSLYVLLRDKETLVFNKRGQLIQKTENNNKTKYYYSEGQLNRIEGAGFKIQFVYENERIVKILESKKDLLRLSYKGSELTSTLDYSGRRYRFEYNSYQNLESVIFPDGSLERIAYNNEKDQVVKVSKASGCSEYYAFERPSDSEYLFLSRIIENCPGLPPVEKIFEFWNLRREDGQIFLYRYRYSNISKNESAEVYYHPYLGSPVRFVKNGKEIF